MCEFMQFLTVWAADFRITQHSVTMMKQQQMLNVNSSSSLTSQ